MNALLQLNDIHFAYPGSEAILRGVDLTLDAGQRMALSGTIGAGKTTLFLVIMGLHRPSQGSIIIFDHERREEKEFQEVRRRIGYLFQDPDDQLFCPTVREDVMFGPLNLGKSQTEAATLAADYLARVGLPGFGDRLTFQLSGGEKRLAALAAVLAMEPDILLLDEPTNDLDDASRKRLLGILRALPQAMLIISHDRELLTSLADTRVWLQDGKLAPA